jgi:hypothetical protein
VEDILPTEFQLSQNYHYAFKERTTIKYCVPGKMKIRLELYDSMGNKIITLVDEIKEAGTFKIELSAKGRSAAVGNAWELPSGEYIYKLESRDYSETKK